MNDFVSHFVKIFLNIKYKYDEKNPINNFTFVVKIQKVLTFELLTHTVYHTKDFIVMTF